jgi:hypothetical protein
MVPSAATFSSESSQRRAEARCDASFLSCRHGEPTRALLNRIGEADRHLAQATDSGDLERRIGEIETRALAARSAA